MPSALRQCRPPVYGQRTQTGQAATSSVSCMHERLHWVHLLRTSVWGVAAATVRQLQLACEVQRAA